MRPAKRTLALAGVEAERRRRGRRGGGGDARGRAGRAASEGGLISRAATHVFLLVLALVTLLPTVWLALAAFKPSAALAPRPGDPVSLFVPAADGEDGFLGRDFGSFTLDNVDRLFGATAEGGADRAEGADISALVRIDFGRAMRNSLFFASATAVFATLVAAAAGYALARLRFTGQTAAAAIILLSLIVPPALLFAPSYGVLNTLGLLDSLAGMIAPFSASAFGVFLFRQATLQSVPAELIDAAVIDGCGEARSFFAIGLPLLKPMVAAFMIVQYLAAWNNFVTPQIVLQSPELFPLSVMIVQLRGTYNDDLGLLMAGTLVSVAPVALMFLLLQRDFVRGLTAGAVKG